MTPSQHKRNNITTALDPALRAWLDKSRRVKDDDWASSLPDTPEGARAGLAAMTRAYGGNGPAMTHHDTRIETAQHTIPLRLYDPDPNRRKPICIYLHGGGHLAGSVDVYDPICRRLAKASGRLVVSVEYRLAPEHPYPAALEDCMAVLQQLGSLEIPFHVDRTRIALAGDSGGGALAATLASDLSRNQEIKLDRLILIYPSLDYTLAHPSLEENGHGYLLEAEKVRWYFAHYFQHDEDRSAASPLYMPLAGLPATLVITAGYCPLRDEGLAYIEQLRNTDVPHEHLHLPDMIHAYLNLHNLVPTACERTYEAMGQFLRASTCLKHKRKTLL